MDIGQIKVKVNLTEIESTNLGTDYVDIDLVNWDGILCDVNYRLTMRKK